MDRDAPPHPVNHLPDGEFKTELASVIPQLRAFARSLCGNRDMADDLVQETMLKAWAARKRFEAGTSMQAWTHTILRNLFRSQMRRSRFVGEWDDAKAEELLSAPGDQEQHMNLSDLQRALLELPPAQREALILVGAGGFAYEEAAEICGCAIGTVKSRVARARAAVEKMLTDGMMPSRTDEPLAQKSALDTILQEVDDLSGN
ncbi:sigma-70 family RNA polymerase sigma factor [Parvibaculum sp.]|uniref:sigma-70 family RNA polymerase sigma factor n=1 Tax=Parvibaculum sp. TaxID=2024848 RepID=UPI002B5F7F93|nr:sigma-70 family RNA polymerase sigma factor [Parvibaculum sp.]HUD50454.1 sigma-70 family RNA polymerase sigma factor [Parvibaculum sp.]